MATETVRTCDVFGTRNNVRRFRVSVREIMPGGELADDAECVHEIDLSPRGLKRLCKQVEKGVTTPGAANGDGSTPTRKESSNAGTEQEAK